VGIAIIALLFAAILVVLGIMFVRRGTNAALGGGIAMLVVGGLLGVFVIVGLVVARVITA